MTYEEVLANAREKMAPNCKVCPECNGKACIGKIPGVGACGSGRAFTVCREYLSSVKVLMDVIYEPQEIDTSIELFGRKFSMPVFAAPIGGMNMNYNGSMTESEYADAIINGMTSVGSFAFSPDGPVDIMFEASMPYIKNVNGNAVVTLKPWGGQKLYDRIHAAEESGAMALASDVDSSGNLNLKRAGKPVYPMSQEKLTEIVNSTKLPFMPKGVMTARAAIRCADAGCYGIIVSNHGGRVLDDTPAPCSMVPEIRAAVGDRIKIIVDGGIRSGLDVFKCLALGADAVMIGRPYTIAAHGGGEEGVRLYSQKILAELQDAMRMTGCNSLKDIGPHCIKF